MAWVAPEVRRTEGPQVGDDREILLGFLEFHRATFLMKCGGLTGEQLATWAVPPSNLSLLGLIRHMTDVETSWFQVRVGGRTVKLRYFDADSDDPDFDFTRAEAAGAERDYGYLIEAIDAARAVLDNVSFDHTFEHPRHGLMSTRWVVTHMIEEYARHNGHADLLRERIDGATGE